MQSSERLDAHDLGDLAGVIVGDSVSCAWADFEDVPRGMCDDLSLLYCPGLVGLLEEIRETGCEDGRPPLTWGKHAANGEGGELLSNCWEYASDCYD